MRTLLYLGLEKPELNDTEINLIHYPIIQIIPKPPHECFLSFSKLPQFTHFIFTSKTSVSIFFKYLAIFSYFLADLREKQFIAVGQATAKSIKTYGIEKVLIAQNETAEGIVDLLKTMDLKNCYIFWPHSALSRDVIHTFLSKKRLKFEACVLYDTAPFLPKPLPDLNEVDEIVFTSPSTVSAFLKNFSITSSR